MLSGLENLLNEVYKKYYVRKFLIGLIWFFCFLMLSYMIVGLLEDVMWMSRSTRFVLFIIYILGVVGFLIQFLFVPALYRLGILKGLSKYDIAKYIGRKNSDVEDKVVNYLQLKSMDNELANAAYGLKENVLQVIEVDAVVDYRDVLKYMRWLLLPLSVLMILLVSNNFLDVNKAFLRVIDFKSEFIKPAPFSFQLQNDDLFVTRGQDFVIKVSTVGDVQPDAIELLLVDTPFLMKKANGLFVYTITDVQDDVEFNFSANGYVSDTHLLSVKHPPLLEQFEVTVTPPKHTGLAVSSWDGVNDMNVPEGSKLSYEIVGKHISEVSLEHLKDTINFKKDNSLWYGSLYAFDSGTHSVILTNNKISDPLELKYNLSVIRDEFPSIVVEESMEDRMVFNGLVQDDYAISKLELVYFSKDREDTKKVMELGTRLGNSAGFGYSFPDGLVLLDGVDYEFYFQVTDNDLVNGGKVSKSQVFETRIMSKTEKEEQNFNENNDRINLLQKELDNGSEKDMEKLLKDKKEGLDFEDRNQFLDLIKAEQLELDLMKRFKNEVLKKSEGLMENELLRERMDRMEKEAQKNEELLKEFQQLMDSLNKDKFESKVEDYLQRKKMSQRNLEQLLELTKRYLLEERMNQLAARLDSLSVRQESNIVETDENLNIKQVGINKEYEDIKRSIEKVLQDNNELSKPLKTDVGTKDLEQLKDDLDKLREDIVGEKSKDARSRMPFVQEQMNQLAEGLRDSAASDGGKESIAEDAEMLRQILENLVDFSLAQENLLEEVLQEDGSIGISSKYSKEQAKLKTLFEHVDDSIYSLSLRRIEIGDVLNPSLVDVQFNLDKSIEAISEKEFPRSTVAQQYVVNGSNFIADYLAKVLDNMEMSMQQGQGEGGSGFQLPDIIKAQGSLGQGGSTGDKGGAEGDQGKSKAKDGSSGQGKGGKEGSGNEGDSGSGSGSGNGDGKGSSSKQGLSGSEFQEAFEIFKEQSKIRVSLEEQLKNLVNPEDRNLANTIVGKMKSAEERLLNEGLTYRTRSELKNIGYELLKLENAELKQGQDSKRQSSTNEVDFQSINGKGKAERVNKVDVEILKRDVLPLNEVYRRRVKLFYNEGY